jgi:outer membrane protein insertion porin family
MKRTLTSILCLLLLMATTAASAFEVESFQSGLIRDIIFHDLGWVSKSSVRALLPFKAGARYHESKLSEAILLLKQWGRFTNVTSRVERQEEDYIIHLHFTHARLIGEIFIHGNYPILEGRVRRQLALRPGDVFDDKKVDAQRERIRAFYAREGYFHTDVQVKSAWWEYTGEMRVHYYIDKGQGLRWGNIALLDNTHLPSGRIRTAFPMWGFYTPSNIRKGRKRLERYYQALGYPKARVRLIESTPRFAQGRMDLTLKAHIGPHLDILFDGNRRVSNAVLKQQLTFYQEGRYDSYEIERSILALKKRYRDSGFLDADITFTRDRTDREHQILTFHIVEGKQRSIWRVAFAGNTARNDTTLQSKILTHPLALGQRGTLDPFIMEEDIEVLQSDYRREGFLDAHIGPVTVTTIRNDRFHDVTFTVAEGNKYHIGTITFLGNFNALHDDLMRNLQLQPKRPARLDALAADRQTLLLFFNDHGYPYATVVQNMARDDATQRIHLVYDINEGPLVFIGQILISGDFITSQRAIRRALKVKPGDPYSDRRILESLVQLRRLGAFRNVKISRIGLDEHRTIIPLSVHVEEEKPFLVDLEVGYSTDDNVTGELRFANINSFGWAKRTQLLLRGGQDRARGEIAWHDPNFFSTDLLFTSQVFADRNQDVAFDLFQVGGAAGVYRQYHRTGYHLRYQLAQNRVLGGASNVLGRRDTTISQISSGITFDTRDKFSDPSRGVYLFSQVDIFNEIGQVQANFARIDGGGSMYIPLSKWFRLTSYGRLGGIITPGNVDIPITERFFLGGDNTIRGFGEDRIGPVDSNGSPLGANVRWIYNAELAAVLGASFRLVGFFDIGSLTNHFNAINTSTVRESVGVGLRYVTPIGPIRADYAYKLDRQPGEGADRFHFTFGYVF